MAKLLLDCRDYGNTPKWQHTNMFGWGPKRPATRANVSAVAKSYPHGLPCILNIENWEMDSQGNSLPAKYPQDLPRFIQVIDWFRDANPGTRVGFYMYPPYRDFWNAAENQWNELTWKIKHEEFRYSTATGKKKLVERGLAHVVDFAAPSLYTFYVHTPDLINLWFDQYATDNIQRCRELNLLSYPVLWPRVHGSNSTGDRLKFVGEQLFKRQILWCLENCDGVVIWDTKSEFQEVQIDYRLIDKVMNDPEVLRAAA